MRKKGWFLIFCLSLIALSSSFLFGCRKQVDFKYSIYVDLVESSYDYKTIYSKEELKSFSNDAELDKFDESFFKENYLIFVCHETNARTPNYSIDKMYLYNKTLNINIKTDYEGIVLQPAVAKVSILIELNNTVNFEKLNIKFE